MGAALLKSPGKLVEILTSLVSQVGIPRSVPISVKIRLLDPLSETVDLVRRLCTTGIARVTVHCRTIPMRPREAAIRGVLASIANVCHEAGVECFANGDVESRAHAQQLIEEYGVDGCMIARAAEANPSVFLPGEKLPWSHVAREYLRTAIEFDNHFPNTKFCLSHIVPGKSDLYAPLSRCKTIQEVREILSVPFDFPQVKQKEEKISSGAVEKAKSFSETAKAAGGGVVARSGGKKASERGVPTHLNRVPEQEP
jgi:tRNA-dihydrouridine synthase 2